MILTKKEQGRSSVAALNIRRRLVPGHEAAGVAKPKEVTDD